MRGARTTSEQVQTLLWELVAAVLLYQRLSAICPHQHCLKPARVLACSAAPACCTVCQSHTVKAQAGSLHSLLGAVLATTALVCWQRQEVNLNAASRSIDACLQAPLCSAAGERW